MLRVNDLTYRIGDRVILDGASFTIPEGARVGLVGRNGAGKTTLFRAILGDLPTDDRAIGLPKGMRIGAVAQEAPAGPETLHAVVLAADTERARLMQEAETADGIRRAEIETRLVDIGAHSAPARAAAILHGLGFDAAAQARPCSDFSGGWRMRVALAAVLFSEPDLLLLDEPTNYLDIEGTLWLYDYLQKYPRTAIIISHDRDLLDESVDHILHLDRGKLTIYRGGYTSFARQLAEKRVLQAKAKAKQDVERAHLQSFIDRFKAKATKARQAQSRMKRLAKMEPIAALIEDDVPVIHLPSPEKPLSPPIVAMERVQAGYADRIVLSGLNLSLAPDDRVALLGANGNGKSTFCKLIGGRLAPLTGQVKRSSKMDVAYFAQHQLDELRPAESAVAHVRTLMPGEPEAKVRSAAARLGFGAAKADTPVQQLSGGEKARLLMGLAAFRGPHLLILDEPTNHLDIESRQALVEAINDYEGAVILVSHDRFLVEACADRLWLVSDGTVKTFDGDMDDYRRLVLAGPEREERDAESSGGKQAEARRAGVERRAALAPMRKRLEGVEARMAKLTAAIAKIDAALEDGTAFRENAAKAGEIARMRAEAADALAAAEEEWLNLSAEIEAA
ncbi:ABC-F family ATP-binding cassette domain-containing protein [Methylobacterium gregans]|uniref:ABC transporter ATP-binding protein YheS n=1 Tax=Methylobacterium gregans TaxID=374424 RepID=A0AA37HSK3_9HYPH|nr:ABC-F family ATP-binding cassette domain-containing protein [Methylobacterium gregans]MDQ0520142.1 ATP-binding cassette subfamily F protein 3 [Methylobacterium gregans]GJD81040.1 putative ABC transporter ATP-binding protein YheS [Methylobacterium gregans]GLS52545.1 glycosyl transferase family 1 [Methylobacterium gregans]